MNEINKVNKHIPQITMVGLLLGSVGFQLFLILTSSPASDSLKRVGYGSVAITWIALWGLSIFRENNN